MARWAIAAASLLTAFQSWLWASQFYWIEAALAFAVSFAFAYAAWRPGTGYAQALLKPRVLRRGADESERAYWFRVVLSWVSVAVASFVAALGIGYMSRGAGDFAFPLVTLVYAISLAALCMALQSLLYWLFPKAGAAPPNNSLERTRER